MKIRPLHDRVVVRRKEEEQTTAGGILLPGAAAEKPNQGEVVAVGNGRVLDNGDVQALAVNVGDIVVFGKYSGSNTITVDGEELLILNESENLRCNRRLIVIRLLILQNQRILRKLPWQQKKLSLVMTPVQKCSTA